VTVVRSYVYPANGAKIRSRLANYLSFALSSTAAGAFALPKVDFVLTESPPPFLNFTGFLLSKLKRGRWILNVADLSLEGAIRLGMIREGHTVKALRAVDNFFYRKAWLVSGQSREILESVLRSSPEAHTYHLSNGVDTRRFNPGLGSKDIRIALGDGQGCLAVYAGLHGIAQGLDQVLDAAAMLQDMKDLSIVLIGDGPEKKTLVKHARLSNLKNIRFLDPYPNHAIPAILASADIALIPLREQFAGAVPSKLYEAMGSGLPVVMVAGGEAGDILQKAKAGMVIPPGDVEALASALRLLARDREKRVELGKNGRQAAITLFDRRSIADKFIDFLEKAARG
jgi:glycosyltransferase involved in cell wall biosynthesis